jgi:hypothetical protein
LAAGQAAHGITEEKDVQQIAGAQLGTAKRCSRAEEAANAVFIFADTPNAGRGRGLTANFATLVLR